MLVKNGSDRSRHLVRPYVAIIYHLRNSSGFTLHGRASVWKGNGGLRLWTWIFYYPSDSSHTLTLVLS